MQQQPPEQGDPNPHAGGYWLKTLCIAVLGATHVHFALSEDPQRDEIALLDAFTRELSPQSCQRLHAERFQLRFANLERRKGERKLHSIGRPHVPRALLPP